MLVDERKVLPVRARGPAGTAGAVVPVRQDGGGEAADLPRPRLRRAG